MVPKTVCGNIGRVVAVLMAAFASTTAFAGRYWQGNTVYFSDTANWHADSGGESGNAGGATLPGSTSDTGATYWRYYRNGHTVFDNAYSLPSRADICTYSSDFFVWDAQNPSYGFTAADAFIVGSDSGKSPACLQINDGSYTAPYLRIGYAENVIAKLTVNNGTLSMGKVRVGGGKTGVDGALTLYGGTLSSTGTGDDVFMICDQPNTKGTLVIEGGTLNTTGGNQVCVGGVAEIDAQIYVNAGGVWNANVLLLGGKRRETYSVSNSVAKLYVNGGTLNLSGENGIGYANGEGSYAEMIVNGGEVNCNYGYFYLAERAAGALTINGGTFTMTSNPDGGLTFGRNTTEPGILTLNGGVLATSKLRLDKLSTSGCRVIFNGGTLKALNDTSNFINASDYIECVVKEGGLVVDTDGYDVTIAHDLVLADGVTSAPLVKKGEGKLTIIGATPFTAENTDVQGGSVSFVSSVLDGSAGGYLGTVALQGPEMYAWLTNPDFLVTTDTYKGDGKTPLEQPRTVIVRVGDMSKSYENLEIGITTNDTLNGVSYSFSTLDLAPRTLRVMSPVDDTAVVNVRDFGGWPLLGGNGARTRQGVIFRGGNLDSFAGATSEQRAASALAGLKSEIDMRPADEVGSGYPDTTNPNAPKSYAAVGADYVSCPTTSSSISSGDSGRLTNAVHRVFSTLGTPGMLPSYVHCRIGRDRTGMIGLLLLGLMGVEEEVLYRDCLVGNFANIDDMKSRNDPKTFLTYILAGTCRDGEYVYNGKDSVYGVSVASRCRQYLEMCGVTTEEINNITMALSGETADEVLARVNAYETANGVRTIIYESYEGSGVTNAIHRLRAGEHILPTSNPTRSLYAFDGWDTGNAVTNEDGTVTIYAKWLHDGHRFWADEGSAPITSATSWNPELDERGLLAGDKLGINQGIWKVVSMSEGETTVDSIYVGWGTEDGSTMDRSYDHGGRLDITGGTLNVTNYFYVGGSYSDRSNNVVNVTGGKLSVGKLRTAYCNCNGGKKCDTLNISGGGIVEAGLADNTHLAASNVGLGYVNVTNGGTFVSHKQMDIGYRGEAHFLLDDGTATVEGTVNVGRGKDSDAGKGYLDIVSGTWTSGTFNVGNGADCPCYGEANVYGGTLDVTNVVVGVTQGTGLFVLDGGTVNTLSASTVGNDAACTGTLHIVSGTFNAAGDTFRIGRNGRGVLTMDGGTLNGVKDLKLGTSGTAGYGEVNLNGGTINAGKVTTSATSAQTMNWNGGTLSCNGLAGTVTFFPVNTYVALNVLRGGAIYETAEGRGDESVEIAQPMSGIGAFVKRGGGTLSLTGDLDLGGGFKVEGGTLNVSSLSRTYFLEITVGAGCTLNLNGASVKVLSYKVAGMEKGPGVYSECGGTITVAPVGQLSPDTAEWTNYAGDEDTANPSNWIVKTSDGLPVYDALPDTNTDVFVPVESRRKLADMTYRNATLVVAGTDPVYIRNGTPPELVSQAIAWYDPDDIGLLTLDGSGGVVGIKNKGTAGESLDLVAYNAGNVPKRTTSSTTPGREPLEFLDGTTLGFMTTNAFNAVANGFTLFAVEKRTSGKNIYGIELDNADGTGRLGGIAQVSARANCTVNIVASEGAAAEEYRFTGTGNDSSYAYVWCTEADNSSTARAFSARLLDGSMEYKTGSEPSYYSLADVGTEQRIYYGMRRSTETGSGGLLGEAMVFASRLSTADRETIRDYLYNKWLISYDLENLPDNILVREGATIDYGGGQWTFTTVKGTGTIANANVVVARTIEPGLTVGGMVTFAPGARFDISPLDNFANGTEVVFLTANKIEAWPPRASSSKHAATLSLVQNADGTVSLVGTLASAGFSFYLR